MLYSEVDSIKGFSRCRGYWSILLSICCVYICSAGYVELPIVLLYQVSTSMLGVSHAVQIFYTKLKNVSCEFDRLSG